MTHTHAGRARIPQLPARQCRAAVAARAPPRVPLSCLRRPGPRRRPTSATPPIHPRRRGDPPTALLAPRPILAYVCGGRTPDDPGPQRPGDSNATKGSGHTATVAASTDHAHGQPIYARRIDPPSTGSSRTRALERGGVGVHDRGMGGGRSRRRCACRGLSSGADARSCRTYASTSGVRRDWDCPLWSRRSMGRRGRAI